MRRDPKTQLWVMTKQLWEETAFGRTFKGRLDAGDSLLSVDSVVVENQHRIAGSVDLTVVASAVMGDGNEIGAAYLKGGAAGEAYKISIRCVTVNGHRLERDFLLEVID